MPAANSTGPLLPDFLVLINGSRLPIETALRLIRITIEGEVNLLSMVTLELTGSATAPFTAWIDDPLFTIGNEIEVQMGYEGNIKKVFNGEITGLEPEFVTNREPSMVVRGYDRRHRLLRGSKTRTFLQLKDSEIASQIASEAGLATNVTDSKIKHDYILQAGQSDLDFLQQRARAIQYEVIVENKTLVFRPVANAASAVIRLSLKDDLLEFYPRLTSLSQVSDVKVTGWNPKDKKSITGKAASGSETSTMGGQTNGGKLAKRAFGQAVGTIIHHPVAAQAEADQIAQAKLNQASLGLIYGEGVCLGRTDLQAGKVIELNGLGKQFSGLYYVTAATHRYDAERGYFTHFTVRRNAI